MKKRLNDRLLEIGSKISVISILSIDGEEIVRRSQKFDCIILSTGLIIDNLKEYQKFTRRLFSKNAKATFCFDTLYSSDFKVRQEAEKELRSNISSKNSIAGWKTITKERRREIASKRSKKAWSEGRLKKESIKCKGWNRGLSKESNESLKNMGDSRRGADNPMSREKVLKWPEEKIKAYRKKLSDAMKSAIENGKFTPNIHNSKTHWTATFDGKTFRSSLEAAVSAILEDHYIFEDTRIRYYDGNEERIYIVDFTSHLDKMMIEVKPSSLIDQTSLKTLAGMRHAKDIGYDFSILSEKFLIEHKNELKMKSHRFSIETWKKIEGYIETNK